MLLHRPFPVPESNAFASNEIWLFDSLNIQKKKQSPLTSGILCSPDLTNLRRWCLRCNKNKKKSTR
jgi:hypothetical protein